MKICFIQRIFIKKEKGQAVRFKIKTYFGFEINKFNFDLFIKNKINDFFNKIHVLEMKSLLTVDSVFNRITSRKVRGKEKTS